MGAEAGDHAEQLLELKKATAAAYAAATEAVAKDFFDKLEKRAGEDEDAFAKRRKTLQERGQPYSRGSPAQ